jgi:hypothetical protein
MTIKVEIKSEVNKSYKRTRKINNELIAKKVAFTKAIKALKGFIKLGDPIDEAGDRTANQLNKQLADVRHKLKVKEDNNKSQTVINVTSDKKWLFFKEFECQDSGRTLYGSLSEYQVVDDVPLRYRGKGITLGVNFSKAISKDTNIKTQMNEAKDIALEEIRAYRKNRKQVSSIEKEISIPGMPYPVTYQVYAGGGLNGESRNNKYFIHMEKGEILKLKEATKLRKIFEAKKPTNDLNHVGIEIEFISKSDKFKLATILAKNNLSDYVELKDDGSLRPEEENGYPHGHELCVLAPEVAIHEVLRLVTKSLDEAGCKVNGRCGLHVHVDVRNRDKDVVFNNFVRSQNIMYAMNPKSRLDGTKSDGRRDEAYSKRVDHASFQTAMENLGGKYWGVNPMSYARLKTIEIRLHSGSTNFTKISNWVKIITNIANTETKYRKDVSTVEDFCDRLHLNDEMKAYINERVNKFKDKSGQHVTVDEAA